MQRRCANCKGKVSLTKATFTLYNNDGDSYEVSGLGTWHCENGCPRRVVLVTTYVGAGKQGESKSTGPGTFAYRDENLLALPRLRSIKVEYGKPQKRGAT